MSALARTKTACKTLGMLPENKVNAVLKGVASALMREQKEILAANANDLSRMNEDDPRFDRLALSPARLAGIAGDMKRVAALPSPLGRILEERTRPNGLHLTKVSVPLGVIGVIYEARPNVTADVFALCFKSGNSCVLKGGRDARHSNRALAAVIRGALEKHGIDPDVLLLLPPDRRSASALMTAHGMVDVLIPRGGRSLIEHVRRNARIPVIETGAGIVHTYIDASADVKKAAKIVFNAKTRRPGVCNALDTLLIHRSLAGKLPEIVAPLLRKRVLIFADDAAFGVLKKVCDPALLRRAQRRHFGVEFLSLKMSIRTVKNLDEALAHIARYGSRHSEAIVARDKKIIGRFLYEVDAAAVYSNASTTFTDGAQFGMGTEIGISTQKIHARGPMALPELTSYKWIVRGRGQVRP
ncbi:glutamate-5-semialdehyde dehydrogenase [Candidatus Peregrinibacteria bacterium]|nr:glutamate-5-semialdehyde dehydrogenase [Candidatus Peregrinibacteria bacterium]